jgi:hypothetical protein
MIVFFGVTWGTWAKIENVGSKPGVICSSANADRRGCAATRITLGAGGGMLVSKTTLSGSGWVELILMTGLWVLLYAGSAVGSGTSQFMANSTRTSAAPTKTKYFIRGI